MPYGWTPRKLVPNDHTKYPPGDVLWRDVPEEVWEAQWLAAQKPPKVLTAEEIAQEKIDQKLDDERNEREWKSACRVAENERIAQGYDV